MQTSILGEWNRKVDRVRCSVKRSVKDRSMAGENKTVAMNYDSHSHNNPLLHSFTGEPAVLSLLPRILAFPISQHVLLCLKL